MSDGDLNAQAERIARAMMSRDAFSRWLGIEILDTGPQRCTCRLLVRDDMVNGFGVAHGGIAFSLADSAFAFACNSGGSLTVSIENAITYPLAVHPGDVLTAAARREAGSARLSYYVSEVRNQRGDVIAVFRGTAYHTGKGHPFDDP